MGEIRQKISVGRTGKWVRVNMVFDSGATASYLKESIAKRIQAPKFQVIETILGDGSIVEGYLSQIKLKIGNRIGLLDVNVLPTLDGDLFIGQDFMQMNDVLLDMKNERFIFGKGQPIIKRKHRLR